jgi:hypothetical protein
MTPEAQRIAIAEACGWKLHSELDNTWCAPHQSDCPLVADLIPLPDYLFDLNAMHEAEKALSGYNSATGDSQYGRYITALQRITNWNRVPSAIAAQRAEAFLRALNLWKP